MRHLVLMAAALFTLPLSGCCSLARLFCGPDQSPWVSVDYQTPKLAVRTFLEALRRDDPEIVYLSLSTAFRESLGIDSSTTQMAWPKIREQIPGLHLAGYAEVPRPTLHGLDHASVTLDVEGVTVELELVRQAYWEVRYTRPGEHVPASQRHATVGGHTEQAGAFVTAKRINDDEDRSLVTLRPLSVAHFGIDEIPTSNIDFAGFERKWKVSALRMIEP